VYDVDMSASRHMARLPRILRPDTWLHIAGRTAGLVLECLVRGYQIALSPLLIGTCKFCPSCSEYFIGAVREWGAVRGSWIGIRRLLRCHPFSQGGIDPVPRKVRSET
jgi:putative membrane protein insertion efficiency factor